MPEMHHSGRVGCAPEDAQREFPDFAFVRASREREPRVLGPISLVLHGGHAGSAMRMAAKPVPAKNVNGISASPVNLFSSYCCARKKPAATEHAFQLADRRAVNRAIDTHENRTIETIENRKVLSYNCGIADLLCRKGMKTWCQFLSYLSSSALIAHERLHAYSLGLFSRFELNGDKIGEFDRSIKIKLEHFAAFQRDGNVRTAKQDRSKNNEMTTISRRSV